jgi:hypothetical protein
MSGGTQSTSTMMKDVIEVGAGNIIKTTIKHFSEEQKKRSRRKSSLGLYFMAIPR